MEKYRTGTGQNLLVHEINNECLTENCVIHCPSAHSMYTFRTHWREDRGIMERICPHGVGHPDPDGLAFIEKKSGKLRRDLEAVHGCDGCCA